MADNDLPAAFEFIYNTTQQNITYIGHSQGASIMLTALTQRDPTILKYMKKFVALAPVTYLADVSLLLKALTATKIGYLIPKVGIKEFLVLPPVLRVALAGVCHYTSLVCTTLTKLAFDSDLSVDNLDRFSVYFGHFPAGTSSQNFEYWNQLFVSGFRKFDYGYSENVHRYGRGTPPDIDLTQINIPVHLFSGISDVLAPPAAIARVVEQLGENLATNKVYNLGHMSFVWAKNVRGYFKDVLEVIKK